jgi:hypothetical protein
MRPVALLTVILFVSAAATFGQSPSAPTLARVKGKAAVVRAAPGENSPDTGTLDPGAFVTVVGAEGADWLTVQPPNGSVSWISWALVEPQGKPGADGKLAPPFNAVVRADNGAMLRAGTAGGDRPLGVQRTKLPEGTVVKVIGPRVKVRADGDESETSWYPIVAPADDYRFVRRDAVEWTGSPPGTGFVVKAGASGEKPLPMPVAPAPSSGDWPLSIPNATASGRPKRDDWPNHHPTFREAEKARGNGDTRTAERLYRQVADEVSRDGPDKDIDLANLCHDRLFLLKKSGAGGGDWTVGSSGGGSVDGGWRPLDQSTPLPTTSGPSPRVDLPKADLPKAEKVMPEKAVPEAAGYLKPTTFRINKRLIYVLVDSRGRTTNYVTSGGVDLDRYADKWVTVRGEESKPAELRGYALMTVTQIVDAK